MNKAVLCIAKNKEQAEQIIEQLKAAGFSNEAISVLFSSSDIRSGESFETTHSYREDGTVIATGKKDEKIGGLGTKKSTKASEGAAAGGTAGGIAGGALGLLVGLGALAIPGMGPFIAAGPIMAALAGSAVGGSIGLLTGALVGLGMPEYEAVHYAEKLKNRNNILISVHTVSSEDVARAEKIYERNGAEDIASTHEVAAPGKRSSHW